jgi:hypothetical protein
MVEIRSLFCARSRKAISPDLICDDGAVLHARRRFNPRAARVLRRLAANVQRLYAARRGA